MGHKDSGSMGPGGHSRTGLPKALFNTSLLGFLNHTTFQVVSSTYATHARLTMTCSFAVSAVHCLAALLSATLILVWEVVVVGIIVLPCFDLRPIAALLANLPVSLHGRHELPFAFGPTCFPWRIRRRALPSVRPVILPLQHTSRRTPLGQTYGAPAPGFVGGKDRKHGISWCGNGTSRKVRGKPLRRRRESAGGSQAV